VTGVAGMFHRGAHAGNRGLVTRMLEQMRSRGNDRSEVWTATAGTIGVTRYGWELGDDSAGNVLVVDEGDLVIAADASLYYRNDLRRKLVARDVRIGGTTASHLILAAYRAWGDGLVEHLEGDYAFILHDRRGRVFAARDSGGKRPLHYADLGHSLILGSTVAAILTLPACPRDLNVEHVAEAAAGLWSSGDETPFRAVSLLPAGWALSWTPESGLRTKQVWFPPTSEPARSPAFDDAAQELLELLERATDERLAATGVTGVWMSGGWDSTAVFGAGQRALAARRTGRELQPVSLSFPAGDPGHEDDLITAVARHFVTRPHWIHIANVPLIDRPAVRAAERDEPGGHAFENLNRALAQGCRYVGTHVALDGNGGDQLFQVSPAFLADLLCRGRWIAFARESRALGLGGFRDAFRWGVKPRLSPRTLDAATALRRGRRIHATYERWCPPWIPPGLTRSLRERQRRHALPRRGKSCWAYEAEFYLSVPFFPRTFGVISGISLAQGVELRSPLYDQRVIAFAARRPREERCSQGETKRLLRRAMRDVLPEHVLAPRKVRTGVASGYFSRETRDCFPGLFEEAGDSWVLAAFGIVDGGVLARARDGYLETLDPDVGFALLCTLHAEFWMRAQLRSDNAVDDPIETGTTLALSGTAARGS